MALQFKNNASTTLSGSINNTQTSITVINGSNFPVVSAGSDYFFATLYEVSANTEINIEIIKVTATSGNIWTIERAQDGTTGRARDGIATCYVELRYTAASAQEMLQKALNLGDLPNAATARTNLGLGTMATQAASSVAITGGTISGVTLTSLDSTTSIVDNADNTKKVVFEVSGVTTATTRTLTIPNASGTIALTSDLTAGYQPLDSDLTAIAALAANGLVARTGTGTAAIRSLAAPTAGFTITNSDGVSGNPTFVLANDLAAVEGITATGFVKRTAADTWTAASIADGDLPTALTGKTYNGLTLTNNVTGFALAGGSTNSKTLTVQNSITLAGTDATTITLPATTGTVALNNQTFFLGTTSVAINRGSGAISLSGVSIDGSAGSATSATSATTSTNLASGVLGSLPYQSAAATTALLAPNTTTTRNFLRMTGTGTVGAAPAWDTVTKSDVGLSNVENTALSTWAGSANITTLGTVATGTWSATAIAIAKGGTGATTASAGFNALSPITTVGDLIYGSAANTSSRLAGNTTTTRKFLRQTGDGTNANAPGWDTLQDADVPTALTGKTYNALTLTANATGFQLAGGTTSKTLVVNNSLTLAGTDSSTLDIGGGGTLGSAAFTASTAYAPAAGSSNVTTVGTIGSGTWQGSTIGLSYGGTGATTKAGAYNALSPMTTLGDIEYHDGTNGVRLAGNTLSSKRFLTQTGTGTVSAAPGWNAIVDGDLPSALTGKTYNALSLTAAATGFTIAGGTTSKTLTVSNTLTLAGTDSSTLNIGTGGTLGTAAFTASTAYAPAAGSASITTLGTVATGTWNATAIGVAYGGTGLTSYTAGDLLYASGTTAFTKLAKGSANQVLTMNSGATAPQWSTLDLSYLTNTNFKQPVRVATTAALTASLAANVLTNTGTLAALVIDGVTLALNDRVLVKDQATTAQNGIYTVTAVGSGVAAWTLTRAADADTSAEMAGAAVTATEGTTNGGLMFDSDFKASATLNTDAVLFHRVVDVDFLGTWAGSTNITTVGTITSGTWSGTAIVDGKIASALTGKTYNGLSLTAASTGFSIAGGTTSKTLTVNNTLTLSGTDSSTLNIGGGGTLGTAAFTASTAYAPAAGSTSVTTLGTVSSGTWNAGAIAVGYGGTGATDAATARGNLGLAIGTNVQAYDADLAAIAALAGTTGLLRKTAADNWSLDTSSYLTGNQTITLSSDVQGSGSTSIASTLTYYRAPVRAATTANITLSGTQTIDGVALAVSDRVLVKDQSTASQNGIYVVASGAWTRATDSATAAVLVPGTIVFVIEGTANADTGWILNATAPVTVGTTNLPYVQFTGLGRVSLGTGLSATGNTLSLDADLAAIGALTGTTGLLKKTAADTWTLDTSTYLTTAVTSLSAGTTGLTPNTATTGAVTLGGTLNVANGGTGATSASGARTNLGLVIGTDIQAYDADLAAIAALAGTSGLLKKTAADTWSLDTNTYLTSAGAVTSFSAGTTGLTPNTATTGAVTLGGTLDADNGGTGINSYTAGDMLYASSSTALAKLAVGTGGQVLVVGGTTPTWANLLFSSHIPDEWVKTIVSYATTAALSATYANGTSGVGATLTNSGTLAAFSVDGGSPTVGERILVKDQAAGLQNGIYTVTTVGSASVAWVLTRATDADAPVQLAGSVVRVGLGTANGGKLYGTKFKRNGAIGTDSVTWSEILDSAAIGSSVQAYDADLAAIAGLSGTTGLLKKTAADTWSLDTNTYLTANQSISLSGDATGSGSTSISVTLANSGVTAGTYNGTATSVTPFTVDAKGRITSIGTAVTIAPQFSSITSKPTTLSGYGISDAQPLDADLTAIAGLTGTTGLLKKTAADTWSLDTNTYLTSNQSITVSGDASGSGTTAISLTLATVPVAKGGTGATDAATARSNLGLAIGTNVQAYDADLAAIAGLAGTSGFLKKTAADTWSLDTNTYLTGNQSIALTSDVQGSGSTSIASTLTYYRAPVRVATTANITLSGTQTIDGVALAVSDRVLVKDQTTASQNGIYVVASGAWTRATDSATAAVLVPGTVVAVTEGTANAETLWVLDATAPITVGTTSLAYVQLSGLGRVSVGNGLSKTGNSLSLDADLAAIAALSGTTGFLKKTAADTWSLDTSTYLTGNQSITLSGDVSGSGATSIAVTLATVTVAKGGTGATDAATARTNLGLAIGTNVQAYDADLAAIAALAGTTGFLKKTAADTWALDTSTYLTSSGAVTSFSAGTTGLTPSTATTGAVTLAGTLAVSNGGTGATDAATARTNLGVAIGTNVQAYDADLAAIAALAGTSGFLKKTAADTWSLDTSTYLTGNQSITLSGDVSGSGATSIAVTLATVTAAKGGTGQTSYTIGDILYASSTSALSKLAGVATGNALISGGVGTAPSWGKVGLTTHISGTLDVGNGGTGATTLTGLVKGNGTSAFTAAVAGTDYVAPSALSSYAALSGATFTGGISTTGVSITGTASRISGLFDGTVANRTAFQTTTANTGTYVGVTPNGSGTGAGLTAYGTGIGSNASYLSFVHTGTAAEITTGSSGLGTLYDLTLNVGATAVLRLDTSGRVGLQATPSAWNTSAKVLDIGTTSAVWNFNGLLTAQTTNAYYNASSAFIYKTNGYALHHEARNDTGAYIWKSAASGTAGGTATMTDKMTLDASGNLTVTGDITAKSSFSFRNKIINGNCAISQRPVVPTLTNAVQYGPDRWMAAISGGTGISGTFARGYLAGASAEWGAFCLNSSFTSGQPYFEQRIEYLDTISLSGKTVTVSGKLYQDTGSSQNFTIRLNKPIAADAYASTTVIADSTPIAVPSGVLTSFSRTFTLGASDAINGLALVIFVSSPITVTSKSFAITDIQLEEGSIATPFEQRPYATELALCQRFCFKVSGNNTPIASSCAHIGITNTRFLLNFPQPMRGAVTLGYSSLSVTDGTNFGAIVSLSFNNVNTYMAELSSTHGSIANAQPKTLICQNLGTAYLLVTSEI